MKKTQKPDEVKTIEIDHRAMPKGSYVEAGFARRQVFDTDISDMPPSTEPRYCLART